MQDFVAGAALCQLQSADFVAGAALCEPQSADLVAGTALGEPRSRQRSHHFHSALTGVRPPDPFDLCGTLVFL